MVRPKVARMTAGLLAAEGWRVPQTIGFGWDWRVYCLRKVRFLGDFRFTVENRHRIQPEDASRPIRLRCRRHLRAVRHFLEGGGESENCGPVARLPLMRQIRQPIGKSREHPPDRGLREESLFSVRLLRTPIRQTVAHAAGEIVRASGQMQMGNAPIAFWAAKPPSPTAEIRPRRL
jgi:hypothetical protein